MKISPSILDADFKNLQTEIDSIQKADRIHLDIMDGHYVPNLSFGPAVFKKINFPQETEAHLMVDNPENFFDFFADSQGITFHIENTGGKKAEALLKNLKSRGFRAGICVDGQTDPDTLSDGILGLADQILCMSVQAGFGGQKFMPEVLDKIKSLRKRGFAKEIEVDGGINLKNTDLLKSAGADIVVVGGFLMGMEAKKREAVIEDFQKI